MASTYQKITQPIRNIGETISNKFFPRQTETRTTIPATKVYDVTPSNPRGTPAPTPEIFKPKPNPFSKGSGGGSGGYSIQNPSGQGGIEISLTGERTTIIYQPDISRANEQARQQQTALRETARQQFLNYASGQQRQNVFAGKISEPQLYERQIGEFTPEGETNKKIPVTKIFYREPQKQTTTTGEKTNIYEREATPQEIKYFREQSKVLEVLPAPITTLEKFRQQQAIIKFQKTTSANKGEDVSYKQEVLNLGLGFVVSYVDSVEFLSNLFTNPLETVKSIPASIKQGGSYLSSGQFASDLNTNPSYIFGYAGGIYSQFKVGGKAYNYVAGKKEIITPIRNLKIPEFTENQIYVVKGGKEFKLSSYDITGELKPPREKIITTQLRLDLGGKNAPNFLRYRTLTGEKALIKSYISKEILPAQPFRIQTTAPAINNLPFEVVEARGGSNILRYKIISGESSLINPRINNLIKLDEYLLKQYVEAQTQRGIPASIQTAKTFTPRFTEFESSIIKATKTGKYNLRTQTQTLIDNDILQTQNLKDLKISFGNKKTFAEVSYKNLRLEAGKGRTTDLNLALTRTKELLETPELKILTSETFFKDVTKPLSRATGKTPRLKGTVFIKQEPFILDTAPANFITPANIKKTPLSESFKQFQQLEQNKILSKVLPKTPAVKTITKIINPITEQGIIKNSLALESLTRQQTKTPSMFKERTLTTQRNIPSLIEKEALKEDTLIKQIQQPKLLEKNLLKEDQLTKLIQAQKLQEKLLQKPLLKTGEKNIFIPTPIMSNRIYPAREKKKKQRKFLRQAPAYSVFLKQRGKYTPFGSGLPKGLALQKLDIGLRTKLSRTGKIVQTKQDTDLQDISFDLDKQVFRQYKQKNKKQIPLPFGNYIQRSKYSLSPIEAELLQQSKKSSRRRFKW